jgi:hypothetical protein
MTPSRLSAAVAALAVACAGTGSPATPDAAAQPAAGRPDASDDAGYREPLPHDLVELAGGFARAAEPRPGGGFSSSSRSRSRSALGTSILIGRWCG